MASFAKSYGGHDQLTTEAAVNANSFAKSYGGHDQLNFKTTVNADPIAKSYGGRAQITRLSALQMPNEEHTHCAIAK